MLMGTWSSAWIYYLPPANFELGMPSLQIWSHACCTPWSSLALLTYRHTSFGTMSSEKEAYSSTGLLSGRRTHCLHSCCFLGKKRASQDRHTQTVVLYRNMSSMGGELLVPWSSQCAQVSNICQSNLSLW